MSVPALCMSPYELLLSFIRERKRIFLTALDFCELESRPTDRTQTSLLVELPTHLSARTSDFPLLTNGLKPRELVVQRVVVCELLAGSNVAQGVRAHAIAVRVSVWVVAGVLVAALGVVPVLAVVHDLAHLAFPAEHMLAELDRLCGGERCQA
eukprot:scaffold58104_cov57-Phaeocystis_antarctica.AAC.2